jgi:hypothetical protein
MTMFEICVHERANMGIRHEFGYDQHDDHVWRWLNHWIRVDCDRRMAEMRVHAPRYFWKQ